MKIPSPPLHKDCYTLRGVRLPQMLNHATPLSDRHSVRSAWGLIVDL